ncbi:conserved protein of unknown function [Pseudomonas sp. JV551A1]|uniref:Uncharacterized protein n=1 Tax=Pseudomonas inefficax TaxID=2078786 RepID=A0AAQ1SWG4_9PSED|nr:conserved protein of unknown function [Pseudomonas sp. JV551A1]SPO63317.1 conserved protein of unknown function [Pseudomonas inefficax]
MSPEAKRGNSCPVSKGVAKGVFTRRAVLFFICYRGLYTACRQFGKWLSQIVCLMSVDSRREARWPVAGAGRIVDVRQPSTHLP